MYLNMLSEVKFTAREIDIMSCIIKNRTEKKIAQILDISPRTVGSHVQNIMSKVGCNSKDQIIDFIEKSGKINKLQQYYQTILVDYNFRLALMKISKYVDTDQQSGIYIKEISEKHVLLTKTLKLHFAMLGLELSFDANSKNNLINLSIDDLDIKGRSYFQLVFEIISRLTNSKEIKDIKKEFFLEKTNLKNIFRNTFDKPLGDDNNVVIKDNIQAKLLTIAIVIIVTVVSLIVLMNNNKPYVKKYNFETNDIDSVNYLERKDILSQLDEVFDNNRVKVAMLVGSGGSGKTSISKYYGMKRNFELVWLYDQSGDKNQLTALEHMSFELASGQDDMHLLNNISERSKEQKRRYLMRFVQKKLQKLKRWLIIIDNVRSFAEVKEFLSLDGKMWGNGALIINTTNKTLHNNINFSKVHVIEIPELTEDEKTQLFFKTINGAGSQGNLKDAHVKEFLEHIPSFPLDVTIAANYLKQERISIDKYLEYLNNNEKEFIFTQQNIIQEIADYHNTRYDIISLSTKHILEEREDQYLDFLLIISMLHNSNIDVDFLLRLHDEIVVREFLNSMQKYSMILSSTKGPDQLTKQITLHGYTQNMILSYLKTRYGEEKLNDRISLIAKSFRKYLVDIQLTNKEKDLKSIIFHLETFLSNIPDQSDGTFLEINKIIGDFYYHVGSYDLAEKKIKNVYNTYFETLGKTHIKTILTQNLLGVIYRNAGKYKSAQKLLEEGYQNIKLNKQASEKEIAWVMTYLGSVYRNTGQYEKSLTILKEALNKYKSVSDIEPNNVISCKLYLAITYQVIDQYDIAEQLLTEVLNYYENNTTYNISKPIWVRGRLALLYMDTGRLEESEAIFEQNLKYYTENFSRESLEAAWVMVQLGKIYYQTNRIDLSEEYLMEALDIYNKKYHDPHNVTFGWIYTYIATLNMKKGKMLEAERYLKQSYDIYSKFYGINHVKTLKVVSQMQELKQAMN